MCAVPVGSPAIPIRGEPSGESRHFRVGKALDRVLDFGDGAHVRKGADMACRFKSRFGAKGRWRGFRAILKRSGESAADSTAVAGTAAGVSALQPRLRNVTLRSAAFLFTREQSSGFAGTASHRAASRHCSCIEISLPKPPASSCSCSAMMAASRSLEPPWASIAATGQKSRPDPCSDRKNPRVIGVSPGRR